MAAFEILFIMLAEQDVNTISSRECDVNVCSLYTEHVDVSLHGMVTA
jgi:hypothetical protein